MDPIISGRQSESVYDNDKGTPSKSLTGYKFDFQDSIAFPELLFDASISFAQLLFK